SVKPPAHVQGNGMAVAALVVGLVGLKMSVVTGWVPIVGFFLVLLPGLLGVIFCFGGNSPGRRGGAPRGNATARLSCGAVGLALTLFMQLAWGLLMGGSIAVMKEAGDVVGDGHRPRVRISKRIVPGPIRTKRVEQVSGEKRTEQLEAQFENLEK